MEGNTNKHASGCTPRTTLDPAQQTVLRHLDHCRLQSDQTYFNTEIGCLRGCRPMVPVHTQYHSMLSRRTLLVHIL